MLNDFPISSKTYPVVRYCVSIRDIQLVLQFIIKDQAERVARVCFDSFDEDTRGEDCQNLVFRHSNFNLTVKLMQRLYCSVSIITQKVLPFRLGHCGL